MLLHQLCAAHMSRGFLFCKGENVSGSNLLPSGAFACAIRCPRAPSCAKFHTRECRIILLTSSNEHGGCCPHSTLECTDEGAMFALCVCAGVCTFQRGLWWEGKGSRACLNWWENSHPFQLPAQRWNGVSEVRYEIFLTRFLWVEKGWDGRKRWASGENGSLQAWRLSFPPPNNNPKEKGSLLWKFLSRWTLLEGNAFSFDRKVGPTAPWTAATPRKGAIASWQSKKGKLIAATEASGTRAEGGKNVCPVFPPSKAAHYVWQVLFAYSRLYNKEEKRRRKNQ